MASTGLCCASLEDPKTLMKMGLSMVLVGHVNFLLGALVHGVVLRHINLHKQARAMEYAISNVVAITSGLLGIIAGILAIILSKNKRNKGLTWSLFAFSLASALMAAASVIGLFVSMVRAIIHGGRSLLTHCRFPDAIGYSSVTNECPFDPTRIYSTTLILWVPLIVMCVIQLVFSSRCCSVSILFLRLPCCPHRLRDHIPRERAIGRRVKVERPLEPQSQPQTQSRYTEPPRQQPPPPQRHLHRQHRSLPPSERRPLRPSSRERPDDRAGQRPPEEHQLLERGALQRSSFWI